MIFKGLCMNCMMNKPATSNVCPYCGFDNALYTAPDFHLPVFTQLSSGRYIVGKAIGSGGFGITYIAYDTRLNNRVAIKELYVSSKVRRDHSRTILMDTSQNGIRQYQNIRKRFVQEAKTLAELGFVEGLVKVKDYFQENETAYIVMEYLDGKTLKEVLKEGSGVIPFENAVNLLVPIMDALTQMHQAGVIHRDVSLDNIMYLKDRRVKLIDLGGEKRFSDAVTTEEVTIAFKKSAYSPIEQVLGRASEIGPWTDVYALAVTLYRCACGRFPKVVSQRTSDNDIELPSKLGVQIGKSQEEALVRAMAIDPRDRIRSVAEFKRAMLEPKKDKSLLPWIIAAVVLLLAAIVVVLILIFT